MRRKLEAFVFGAVALTPPDEIEAYLTVCGRRVVPRTRLAGSIRLRATSSNAARASDVNTRLARRFRCDAPPHLPSPYAGPGRP